MQVFVKAKTGAKEAKVERLDETHFTVFVTEQPVKGKANEAIQKRLAKHLGVSKSRLKLIRGASSKQKVFELA